MRKTESISVFYSMQCTYIPQGLIKGVFNNSRPSRGKDRQGNSPYNNQRIHSHSSFTNYPINILKFESEHNVGVFLHPTQKPVALMEYLIKTYTNEGETVLDFTMGSGTTMVACQNLNRNGIGIEMDEKYFEIAKKRLNLQ